MSATKSYLLSENAEVEVSRRASVLSQARRIRNYLPKLKEQRDEAAQRLADLEELIRDEEAALVDQQFEVEHSAVEVQRRNVSREQDVA